MTLNLVVVLRVYDLLTRMESRCREKRELSLGSCAFPKEEMTYVVEPVSGGGSKHPLDACYAPALPPTPPPLCYIYQQSNSFEPHRIISFLLELSYSVYR